MKRLQKQLNISKEELEQLNAFEQNSLLGGDSEGIQFLEKGDDIVNRNSTLSCECTYKNNSVITNDNQTGGCKCTCI